MNQAKRIQYGSPLTASCSCHCDAYASQCHAPRQRRKKRTRSTRTRKPIQHGIVRKSVKYIVLKKIRSPIKVRRVERPVTVRKVLRPITVRRIERPVNVCKILRPVTVQSINSPVAVSGVETPIAVGAIAAPVVVESVQQPVSVSDIQSPVIVERIEEDVPIRPLDKDTDSVTIYGSNSSLPVRTDDLGRVVFSGQVQVSPVIYTEKSFIGLRSLDKAQTLPSQDVAIQTTLSYAIVNRSANQVVMLLEISPNDKDYVIDSQTVVPGFTTQALTPLRFLRYIRISYQSFEAGQSALFDVYYQAQSG